MKSRTPETWEHPAASRGVSITSGVANGGNVPGGRNDMARRRLQQKGDLNRSGGNWMLRWHEDQIAADGRFKRGWSKSVCIGPCEGPLALTEKEARRIAWENFLSRLDQHNRTPQSVMTVRQFVEQKFLPEHVRYKKFAGQQHYGFQLPFVLDGVPDKKVQRGGKTRFKPGEEPPAIRRRFGLGEMRLRDVQRTDIQRIIAAMIERGYSVQAAKHVKTVVSAIYTHAERENWFSGTNPARFVKLPEMVRATPHALSADLVGALIGCLPRVPRLMVFLATMTSMNIAEVCGLRWKRVNLSGQGVIMDAELLPAHHAAVREQFYKGRWGSTKARARQRFVLLPSWAIQELRELQQESKWNGPEDPVFAGAKGQPRCENAILKRHLKPAGAKLGMPWLSWHHFRHTFATLADQEGISIGERKALMGHSNFAMTLQYTQTPTDQARNALARMEDKILAAAHLGPQPERKVLKMKRAGPTITNGKRGVLSR